MKKLLLILLCIITVGNFTIGQEPQFEWAAGFGSSGSELGRHMVVDNAGNTYITGHFSGTVDFNPGTGTFNLTSNGERDIFILKLNASGGFVWAKAVGGIYYDEGTSITLDSFGNVYVTGAYQGTVDFDPGPGIQNLTWSGSLDIFVLKLSAAGNFIWVKKIGGIYGDNSHSITTTATGYVYITGSYGNTVDFNPGTGTFNVTSNGDSDIFILKLDISGNFVWVKTMGGSGTDVGLSIKIDGTEIYVSGYFSNTVDFDPGAGISNQTSNGGHDVFFMKLSVNGNFIWAKSIGGSDNDYARSMALSPAGGIYVQGDFVGTVDFNPNIGSYNLTANGSNDVFVAKISSTGNLIWAKSVGGTSQELGLGVTTDAADNVYFVGYFVHTVDFDPGTGVHNLTSNGARDAFIDKLDESGNFIWAINFGGSNSDWPNGITSGSDNDVYLTGFYEGTADFDPTSATYNLTSVGDEDAFVLKLSQTYNSTELISDAAVNTLSHPTYYHLTHGYSTWGAVGIRTVDLTTCNWSMEFYDSDYFLSEVTSSTTTNYVDFVVFDNHHLTNTVRGVKTYRYSGTCDARTEFEGNTETLTVGSTSLHNWTANDVVEIWDVYLTPGFYHFTMEYNSGSANLDMALFSSYGSLPEYQNRNDYIAKSSNNGTNDESFYIEIDYPDYYGFIVWANDANSANVDILVETAIAGIWEGDLSTNWHTPGNWNDNTVPDNTTEVLIPAGTLYSPNISTANANAKSLTLESGAVLNLAATSLYVQQDVQFYGTFNMNNTSGNFYCYGDVSWEPGSECNVTLSAEMYIYGDWRFNAGANVQLNSGYVEFAGSNVSFIEANDPDCYFNHVRSDKNNSVVAVSGVSSYDLKINGSLYIYSGSTFQSFSNQKVIIDVSLNNVSGGHFQFYNGSLEFTGSPTTSLKPNIGDYVNNLIVDVSTSSLSIGDTYSDSLVIKGDLEIVSGSLNSNSNTIVINGDWDNQVGSAGFYEGTGTVIFNGNSGFQYCNGDNFYNVTRSNIGGYLLFAGSTNIYNNFDVYGYTRVHSDMYIDNCNTYSPGSLRAGSGGVISIDDLMNNGGLHAPSGQIYVGDLVDDGLYGVYWVSDSTGLLDITQGTGSGEFVDLNGTINIHNGGTMIVRGGADNSYWPYTTNGSIEMNDGILDFPDQGIRINYSTTLSLTTNITGGTIRTAKSLYVYDDFNPSGGNFEFYGSGYQYLDMGYAPAELYNLLINKSSNQVYCSSANVKVKNDFILESGEFTSPGDTLYVGGDWVNNVDSLAFWEGDNTVCFCGPVSSLITNGEKFYNLIVDKSYAQFEGVVQPTGITVECDNDFHVVDGTYEMDPNTILDVDGEIIIENQSGLNVNDSNTQIFVEGHFTDNNTAISATYGIHCSLSSKITFNGAEPSYMTLSSPDVEFGTIVVDKAPFHSLFNQSGFRVLKDIEVQNGEWFGTVSGLNYYLEGDVFVDNDAIWMDPYGTMNFEGASVQNFENYGGALLFCDVIVNSSNPTYGGVILHSTLQNFNTTINAGTLWTNSEMIAVQNNLEINSGAELNMDGNSKLEFTGAGFLNINTGGTLTAIGSENNEIEFASALVGYWQFNCNNGGTVAAEWASFEDVDSWGVYIWPGGIVDNNYPFNHCTFLPGEPGGSLFWVENSQTFTVNYASFPSQGSSTHNVRKNTTSGQVTFMNYMGSFAGESYDNDPNNNIIWTTDMDVWGVATYVSCNGYSDGAIDITVTGGTSGYSYLWSDGSTLADRTNLTEGYYFLTVTDYYGLQTTMGKYVDEPSVYSVFAGSSQNVSCNGGNDGSLSIGLSGGTPPDFFNWSNGATDAIIGNLIAGTYSLTCTDDHGCIATGSWTITEPAPLNYSPTITNCSSNGSSDGDINLAVAGGTWPYFYQWSNGETVQDVSGLSAGTYTVTITDGNGCTATASYEVTEPSGMDVQNLTLVAGWSIISTYITPFEASVDSVFTPVETNTTIVKNGFGQVYWPAFGVNGIGNMILGEGYQVKMSTTDSLSITGIAAAPELTPISIPSGWSILGYLRQVPGNAVTMMSPVVSNLIIMKNGTGSVYWPAFGVNGIGNMMTGQGYQVKLNAASTLTYAANSTTSKSNIDHILPHYYKHPEPTGNNMTLGIPVSAFEPIPVIGDEIGLFNKAGLLVGSGVFTGSNLAISVWGNDELTSESYGLNHGEDFILKIWNGFEEKGLQVNSWTKGDGYYEKDDIQIVGKLSFVSSEEIRFKLEQNVPNPCKEISHISFFLPKESEIILTVYDILGNDIEVLTKGTFPAGNHSVEMDGQKYASGTYFYRLIANDFVETKQMEVSK